VRAIPTYADPGRFLGSYGRRCEHIKKDNDAAEVRITNSKSRDIGRDLFVSLEMPGLGRSILRKENPDAHLETANHYEPSGCGGEDES